MAQIRRVSKGSNPLSAYRQVGAEGGHAFAALADVAKQAYTFLKPYGDEEAGQWGDAAAAAQRNLGAPPPVPGTTARAPVPQITTTPLEPAAKGAPVPEVTTTGLGPSNPPGAARPEGPAAGMPAAPRGGSSSSSSSSSSGDLTAQNVVDGFVQRGLPLHIAQGFAANAAVESGFDPTISGDGGAAFGLFQHNGPRKRALEAYAREQGRDPGDWETQLDFVMHEGSGPEQAAFEKIMQAQNAEEAARLISDLYERPGIPHMDRRLAAAREISGGGSASSASTPSNDGATLAADTRAALGLEPRAPGGASGSAGITDSAPPMGSAPAPAPMPTMVRTSSGALAPRLFSPSNSSILQAYNAAATQTYLAEALVNGQRDLMDISNQMPLDSEGFRQAAQSYVDTSVEAADPQLRRHLRAALEEEMGARYLGMVDEQHAETRTRAANSNQALVDRYSNDYAQRLAAGDSAGADSARQRLEEVLYARESLPGLAWTREQSQNAILGARDVAARLAESAKNEQEAQWRGTLQTIIDAAKNGQTAAAEGILDDPAVVAALPDLAREAEAFVGLRDYLPSFLQLTPAQQAAQVAEVRNTPVDEGFDPDIVNAMEKVAESNRDAWEEDPILRAQQVLKDVPTIPQFDPANPAAFIAALGARAEYANGLAARGFVDKPAFLSDAESEVLSTMLGVGVPAEARAAVAGAIAAGFGDQGVGVFDQLETDPVTRFGGKLVAMGGSLALATEAMVGQQRLDEGLVQLPEKADRLGSFSPDLADALSALPADVVQVESEVMSFAGALYAARSRGLEPGSEAAKALMEESVQAALGQTRDRNSRLLGGVQDINGQPTLLPLGVSGEDVTKALGVLAGGGSQASDWNIPGRLSRAVVDGAWARQDTSSLWARIQPETIADPGAPRVGRAREVEAPSEESPLLGAMFGAVPILEDAARAITGAAGNLAAPSFPTASGAPIEARHLRNARLVPMGGTVYRIEIARAGTVIDVADQAGNVFLVDMNRLVGLAK